MRAAIHPIAYAAAAVVEPGRLASRRESARKGLPNPCEARQEALGPC